MATNLIPKKEWASIVKAQWGTDIDMNEFDQEASKSVFITRTSNSSWRAVLSNRENAGTGLLGTVGDITGYQFIDGKAVLVASYEKYGKSYYRVNELSFDPLTLRVTRTLSANHSYRDYILDKMSDIRTDAGFPAVCAGIGVSPDDDDIVIADAMSQRVEVYRYNPPSTTVEEAELEIIYNPDSEGGVLFQMKLMAGKTELVPKQPNFYISPRSNEGKSRWRGDSKGGREMLVNSKLTDRRPETVHLFAESDKDLEDVFVRAHCIYYEADGTVRGFRKEVIVDLRGLLDSYNYTGL